ncbi:hypothetical protein LDDCCGHA_3265 [Methylobacterium oxalidis]|nr:hypothetical protein LDDCCGHA_3265 [Methylobacterium oxalidis]
MAPVPEVAVAETICAVASPCTLLSTTRPPIASAAEFCGCTAPGLAVEGSPVGASVVVAAVAAVGVAGAVPVPVPVPAGVLVVPGSFSPSGMKFESSARFQSSLSVKSVAARSSFTGVPSGFVDAPM